MQTTAQGEPIDPTDFYEGLLIFAPGLTCTATQGEQHDPEEFLRSLLDCLLDEWTKYVSGGKQLFKRLFESQVRKFVSCAACGTEKASSSENLVMFTLMPPPGAKKPTLDMLWDVTHAGEGDLKDYKCDKCSTKNSTTIYRCTVRAPEILIFFLQRAKLVHGMAQVNKQLITPIDFTPFTSTFPFIDPTAPNSLKTLVKDGCVDTAAASFDFKSCAVVTSRYTVTHYVALRKLGPNIVQFDDSKVTTINDDTKKQNAANKALLVLYDVQEASKNRVAPCPSI